MNNKKKTVAKKVIKRLAIGTILINFIALCVIGTYVKTVVRELEETHLQDIASHISNSVSDMMEGYISITEVLAENSGIIALMEKSSKTSPMETHPESEGIAKELTRIVDKHSDVFINLYMLDVAQDGYFTQDGSYSDDSFSFSTRPYYSAITSKETVVTTPYIDVYTGSLVLSIVTPVLSDGIAIGAVGIDMSTDFISDFITASDFGETGTNFILDETGNVLAHTNISYMGENSSTLALSGDSIQKEMVNPSGNVIGFSLLGDEKTGIVESIGNFDWILVTHSSTKEFLLHSNIVLRVLLGMLVISNLATLLIVAVTVNLSLKPIQFIQKAMKELSAGNLKYQLEYQSEDEIGELAEDMRDTTEILSLYIGEIHRQLEQCGEGNFAVVSDLTFIGDFDHIQHSIHQFITLISQSLQELKSIIEQVSVGSNYVATGSQTLAEGSSEQAKSIEELKGYMDEITNHIQNNTESIIEANQTAKETTEKLKKSNEDMSEMLKSMANIHRTNDGIQKIVKTIQDIAFQTNILALNAAVEAARAGEAGKGFAVVADEVRNLSTRTTEAVKQTENLITESTLAIKLGGEQAKNTAERLNAVTEDVGEFIETLEEITLSITEQTEDVAHIKFSVEEINKVMQTNSSISEESAASSEELSSQAFLMTEKIDQFQTTANSPSS